MSIRDDTRLINPQKTQGRQVENSKKKKRKPGRGRLSSKGLRGETINSEKTPGPFIVRGSHPKKTRKLKKKKKKKKKKRERERGTNKYSRNRLTRTPDKT